jgi:hypothetical protein
MANTQNLVSLADRTEEEKKEIAKKGGQASQRVQAEKRSFKKAIEWLLNSDIRITQGTIYDKFKEMGIDISTLNIEQQMTLGVALGGIQGNASNYKILMEGNSEIESEQPGVAPTLKIELVDNSNLEKTLYEADRH